MVSLLTRSLLVAPNECNQDDPFVMNRCCFDEVVMDGNEEKRGGIRLN